MDPPLTYANRVKANVITHLKPNKLRQIDLLNKAKQTFSYPKIQCTNITSEVTDKAQLYETIRTRCNEGALLAEISFLLGPTGPKP